MEFRDASYRYAYNFARSFPGMQILGEGLGVYSIAGYDTYAFVAEDYGNPTKPLKGMILSSRIGYQQMTIYFLGNPESFDQRMPAVQKMIGSIKINGI